MSIELIDTEDVISRGGKGKTGGGEKYIKYREAISPHIEWFKKSIDEDKNGNGTIRVRIEDIAREMGKEFISKHDTTLYWGIKYVLFDNGIFVTTGTHRDGSPLFVMRYRKPEDKLPDSLTRSYKTSVVTHVNK